MNSKILLVGNSSETTVEVRSLLTSNKNYKIIQASDYRQAVHKLAQEKTNLVVLDNEVLTEQRMDLLKNLRGLGYRVPVLMLARVVAPKALDFLRNFSKSVILEKPFEHKHFLGVTSKLIEGIEVPQQFHKRFYTKQEMILEQIGKNKKYEGSMLNLSKGGAYLEISDDKADVRGIIKMKVNLSEIDKSYEVNARVIWNSKSSVWGIGQGVGVEFIQAKDVYRNLLNNI